MPPEKGLGHQDGNGIIGIIELVTESCNAEMGSQLSVQWSMQTIDRGTGTCCNLE